MEKQIGKFNFRIRKMNAIELLAFNMQSEIQTFDGTVETFNLILENIEVQTGDSWLPVKEKNKNIFYPSGIENDIMTIKELIPFFMNYIGSVFHPSEN